MAITGRVPLLLLLGLLPVVLRPTGGTVWLWLLAVVVLILVDWALAPRPDGLSLTRRPLGTVRLGQPTETTLVAANDSRGSMRARVRPTPGNPRRRLRQPAPDPARAGRADPAADHRSCRVDAATCARWG